MDDALRRENWQYFKDKHPEAFRAYEALGKAIYEHGPLTERECYLVKVAVAAASQYQVRAGFPRRAGAGSRVHP